MKATVSLGSIGSTPKSALLNDGASIAASGLVGLQMVKTLHNVYSLLCKTYYYDLHVGAL